MKTFTSIDQWKKMFFPKDYERERLAKMSPKESGREMAWQTIERIRNENNKS